MEGLIDSPVCELENTSYLRYNVRMIISLIANVTCNCT